MKRFFGCLGALAFLSMAQHAHATCGDSCVVQLLAEDCSTVDSSMGEPASWPADHPLTFVASCTMTCCAPGGPDLGTAGASGNPTRATCSSSDSDAYPHEFSILPFDGAEPLDVEFETEQTECGSVFVATDTLPAGSYRLVRYGLLHHFVTIDGTVDDSGEPGSAGSGDGCSYDPSRPLTSSPWLTGGLMLLFGAVFMRRRSRSH